jgi:hypothetical protein
LDFRGNCGGGGKQARKAVSYAKYGLLSGAMEAVDKGAARQGCGIWANGRWPSWSLVLKVGNLLDLRWIMGLRVDLYANSVQAALSNPDKRFVIEAVLAVCLEFEEAPGKGPS